MTDGTLSPITAELDHVAEQEVALVFERFDETVAWELGSRMRARALEGGQKAHALVIDVRKFGQPLFYTALAGTSPDNFGWIERKSALVARFHQSSLRLHLRLAQDGVSLEHRFGLSERDYAAFGGAFPVTVRHVGVIGSIAVSGLPHREDHQFVVASLADFLGRG